MTKIQSAVPSLPHWCLLCQKRQHLTVCSQCLDYLPKIAHQCQQCALALNTPGICGQCLITPPSFDTSHCAFHYQPPIDKLIHQFKFQNKLIQGHWLTERLIERLEQTCATADLLLPTPLHWQKQWSRGFNQSVFIAQLISKAFNIPVKHYLHRTKTTSSQMGLNKKQRTNNVEGSFDLSKPLAVYNKHIAIIDDVITTGTTANTMAKLLKDAGASHVSIWAIARTPTR